MPRDLLETFGKTARCLRKNSPRRLANQISIPVLLVHGEDDRVVSVQQSRSMHKAMVKNSKAAVSYLELPEGDHFLSKYHNRIAFAEAATTFLGEHLR